jgi:hypothetical protein
MSRFGLAAAAVLAVSALASARDDRPAAISRDVRNEIDDNLMASIIQKMDLSFDKVDAKTFRFDLDGYKVVLFNYRNNCQLYAGFRADCSIKRVNEWNRTKRFSRAYIDDEGDPCIEADLDFDGGVTDTAVQEFIRTFRLSVRQFARFIEER